MKYVYGFVSNGAWWRLVCYSIPEGKVAVHAGNFLASSDMYLRTKDSILTDESVKEIMGLIRGIVRREDLDQVF